jgi:hypothetical protein
MVAVAISHYHRESGENDGIWFTVFVRFFAWGQLRNLRKLFEASGRGMKLHEFVHVLKRMLRSIEEECVMVEMCRIGLCWW